MIRLVCIFAAAVLLIVGGGGARVPAADLGGLEFPDPEKPAEKSKPEKQKPAKPRPHNEQTQQSGGHQKKHTKIIGTYGDWKAYSFTENGSIVCYASAQPRQRQPESLQRGDVYLLVTHRPSGNSFDVISITNGYTFLSGSAVQAIFSQSSYSLFVNDDTAWAKASSTDSQISASLRRGGSLIVIGTSAHRTNTTDTYSLNGASFALDAIDKACGRT